MELITFVTNIDNHVITMTNTFNFFQLSYLTTHGYLVDNPHLVALRDEYLELRTQFNNWRSRFEVCCLSNNWGTYMLLKSVRQMLTDKFLTLSLNLERIHNSLMSEAA